MHQSKISVKTTIICLSLFLSVVLFYSERTSAVSSPYLSITNTYGNISLLLLILVMLPGPLYRIFPNFYFKNTYRSMLGGLGISTFYFAFLHSYFGFFGVLFGFKGLPFLDNIFLWANLFGLIGLLILAVLAGTSFTFAMKRLGSRWKTIHRFVYVAAFVIVLHVILIGSDFRDWTQLLPLFFIIGIIVLVILNAISLYRYLVMRFPQKPRRLWSGVISLSVLALLYLLFTLHLAVIGHVHHV